MFSTKELFSAMYEFHLFSFFRFSCRTVLLHLKNLLRKFWKVFKENYTAYFLKTVNIAEILHLEKGPVPGFKQVYF